MLNAYQAIRRNRNNQLDASISWRYYLPIESNRPRKHEDEI